MITQSILRTNKCPWCARWQTMSYNTTEPNGYMAAAVSDDGIITLITSRNSYSFNLAWLKLKAPIPNSDDLDETTRQ